MSTFFYGAQHHQQQHHQVQHPHPMPQSHNHHGRSRRAPRLSSAQNSHRQFRGPKIVKEVVISEAPSMTAYRARFEAGRSFDIDDDLEFCPNLLTFDEVCDDSSISTSFLADLEKRQSVTSGSDRSSLSSGSPGSSPLQTQIQPHQITPALSISSAATSAYMSPPSYTNNNSSSLKIHQPSAIRSSRTSAIPIVNPSTGNRIASPPSSISPGMMQQTTMSRRW